MIIKCRPFYLPREYTAILLVAVYIPPSSNNNNRSEALNDLYQHTSEQQTAHPDAFLILAGDFNHADLKSVFPKIHQHIDIPTRGKNTLDFLHHPERSLEHDDTMGLERFIQLSIRVANRLHLCMEDQQVPPGLMPLLRRPENISPPEPAPEPMQIDNTRLTLMERHRRLSQGLCLYCGTTGHVIAACPIRPPRPMVSAIRPFNPNMYPLSTVIQLTASNVFPVTALIDSGSSGNFISGTLCHQLGLPTTTTTKIYQIQSITGRPLSRKHVRQRVGPISIRVGQLHEETIYLLVLEDSTADVILGRPWLVQHNPIFSWKSGEILKWGERCFPDCFPNAPRPPNHSPTCLKVCSTSIESPVEKQSVDIPPFYAPFSDVFCPNSYLHTGHGTAP